MSNDQDNINDDVFIEENVNMTPSAKEAMRKRLEEEIEAFLSKGGIIEEVPSGAKSNYEGDSL